MDRKSLNQRVEMLRAERNKINALIEDCEYWLRIIDDKPRRLSDKQINVELKKDV